MIQSLPLMMKGKEKSAIKEIESKSGKYVTQNVVIIWNRQGDLISKQKHSVCETFVNSIGFLSPSEKIVVI